MTRADVTFVTPVRVALAEGDAPAPRTISGLGVPFGVESAPDSITRSRYVFEGPPDNVDELVDVVREHDGNAVVGRLSEAWAATDDGLPAAARIFRTRDGDDVLELAREGVLAGFSIATEIARYTEAPTGARHVAGGDYTVIHLGVVRRPAFESAGLTVAASAAPGGTVPVENPPAPVVELPTIAELAAQTAPVVAELLAEIEHTNRHPLATFATFGEFAAAVMHADPEDALRLQAAFAVVDQVTGDNPGVIPPGWRTNVKMNLDARRPAITGTGGPIGLPDAGMDANWPYFDGDLDAIIAEQLAEKTDLTGPKISILKATEPIHTAGAVSDISYQLLLRSSPSYLDAYLRILQAAWARYTEAKYENRLFVEATPSGEAIPTTAEGIRSALFAASSQVEDATGAPATAVGVSKDLWPVWGGLPGLHNPAYGTNNAAGTASAATLQININGLVITRWPFLPAGSAVVTNGEAAKFAEYGPQVANHEDVRKLGRDVGVWGMYEEAEVYFPAGVVKLAAAVVEDAAPAGRSTRK